ncbi:nitrate ABC transporter [Enterococcus sp. JM4C]|uniref:ABC transporter ATP-binding protein n=1 Tax=Candidatus Enterococcus huntleyi TaxID=1857217 RepID=UPI00137A5F5C|nr:ABC transporter ATP-binding protein [Enterococcus sp. JM4C]KAF1298121.1 nitrate ABC transporter [Enterococcus sp. JM4C]
MPIDIHNLTFSYANEPIFKQLSFSFLKGKTYTILGKSGSGKSTLLNLLKGFEQPQDGTIDYIETTAQKVELLFQEHLLFDWQTVRQAIELPLRLTHVEKKQRKEQVDILLRELQLTELSDRFPNQLSGGQKQRVAMARGLITNPDFLLLDEPTSSLDQETKEEVQAFILSEQKKRHNTLVVVTHDIEEAAFLGEVILLVKNQTVTIYENPLIHLENRRETLEFYEFCIKLRAALKGGPYEK